MAWGSVLTVGEQTMKSQSMGASAAGAAVAGSMAAAVLGDGAEKSAEVAAGGAMGEAVAGAELLRAVSCWLTTRAIDS